MGPVKKKRGRPKKVVAAPPVDATPKKPEKLAPKWEPTGWKVVEVQFKGGVFISPRKKVQNRIDVKKPVFRNLEMEILNNFLLINDPDDPVRPKVYVPMGNVQWFVREE